MISEEQLQQYEDMASDYRYDGSVFKPVVIKLIAEVRRTVALWRFTCAELREKTEQLEKEADWLAKKCRLHCSKCSKDNVRCCAVFQNGHCDGNRWEISHHDWREAARKAVQDAS